MNKSILLVQPNYQIFGKRTWKLIPYNLGVIQGCVPAAFQSQIYDPNFENESEAAIKETLEKQTPWIVGLTSFSTEYIKEISYHAQMVKEVLPGAIVILGGVYPTVLPEQAAAEEYVDYCIVGEGENSFPQLLAALDGGDAITQVDGIAYKDNGNVVIQKSNEFIDNLDDIPLPDYYPLDIEQYGMYLAKYSHTIIPRNFPSAVTISSRGCPYQCVFCAGHTVSGKKVRMRSAENILHEIDELYLKNNIREIIFLDDHFLYSKQRASQIMEGLIERQYDLTWKCVNVAIFSLDKSMLQLMKNSGCYQLTVSIESGNQRVLRDLIKKPVNLEKSRIMVAEALEMGFEVISNFVFGFPGETWEEIRETIKFAEDLDLTMANFHIATPLPRTELMETCLKEGLIDQEDELRGYTQGVINTDEFSSMELQILRAFEWDRINFHNDEKKKAIARIEGLSLEEVAAWRKRTRLSLGATVNWKE